jgi:hypothetical protein
VDDAGIEYEDALDFVQVAQLDFCCCGSPRELVTYVRDGLRLLQYAEVGLEAGPVVRQAVAMIWQDHFRTPASEAFFWYWCDQRGLTEHGVRLPGLLTSDGEQLLADLDEALRLGSASMVPYDHQ